MHEELASRVVDTLLVAAIFGGKALVALWGFA